eukprot:COSAG01_NODE_47099_length_393_cov_2.193878_1_plen_104_part_10
MSADSSTLSWLVPTHCQQRLHAVHYWYGLGYGLGYLVWVWIWYLFLSPERRTADGWIYPFLNWNNSTWPLFYLAIPLMWVLLDTRMPIIWHGWAHGCERAGTRW